MGSLYILDASPLYDMWFANTVCIYGLAFHSLKPYCFLRRAFQINNIWKDLGSTIL